MNAFTKKTFLALASALGMAFVFPATVPAADYEAEWTGSGYADWMSPTNWRNGLMPVASGEDRYNVTINSQTNTFVQCSLKSSMEVYRLTLGNALYVYGDSMETAPEFNVRDEFRWVGGVLDGWGTKYHLYGDSVFEGSTYKGLSGFSSLTIHKTARWTAGHLRWSGYGRVNIQPGAVFDIQTGGVVGSSATTDSADIYNAGTLRMNAPGQSAVFYGIFHNTGNIDVQAGDLVMAWTFDGGAMQVAPGARLILNGPNSWSNCTLTGGGELVFSGREQDIAGDVTFPILTRIGTGFSGPANVTLHNAVWSAGDMSGPGSIIIPVNGKLDVTGVRRALNRGIANKGVVRLFPGALTTGWGNLFHVNSKEGKIRLASDTSFGNSSFTTVTLVNEGEVLKDDGAAGAAGLYVMLDNRGTIACTAGLLNMVCSGTNHGRIDVKAPGFIDIQGLEFSDTSSLTGDGRVTLRTCNLRGSISPELNLVCSQSSILTTNISQARTLELNDWLTFREGAGLDVSDYLFLNGSLGGGRLRSVGIAELDFRNTAEINSGCRLELLGPSGWQQGTLTVRQTNSALVTADTLHVLGKTTLSIKDAAALENTGAWLISPAIKQFQLILNDSLAQFSTDKVAGTNFGGAGPSGFSGPIVAKPRSLDAGPGAELTLSHLAGTNSTISLRQGTLAVTESLSTEGVLFLMKAATIRAPASAWSGSATLSGWGTLAGALGLRELQLRGAQSNNLVLSGSLELTGTNPVFQIQVPSVEGVLQLPVVTVQGPVSLRGQFELSGPGVPGASAYIRGPVTVLESDLPLDVAFTNAPSGAVMASKEGRLRFRLYYGASSPFGPKRIVIQDLGTAFDQWRLQRFAASELGNASISGAGADPDGNGFNNIADFALAISPANSGADLPLTLLDPAGYALVRLRGRKDTGGLETRIAVSTNLTNWSESLLGQSPSGLALHRAFDLGDCNEYIYRWQGAAPASLFLRITVTAP